VESLLASLADRARRRRRAIVAVWVALFLVSAPLAGRQTERLSGGGWDVPGSESVQAMERLEAFPGGGGEPIGIFVEGEPSAVRSELTRAERAAVLYPELVVAGERQLFEGGHAALRPLRYVGDRADMYDFAGELREELVRDAPGARTRVVGEVSMWSNFQEVSREQLARAELIGFPFIVAILLLAFGTLLAALMPIGVAVAAVVVTGAVTFLLAGRFEISIYTTNMATMIGIGVAVDYSLFIVGRFRRGLREGKDERGALRDALASAGTAAVYSGATVILSLAGLFLVDVNAIRSMALGAIVVVAVAVLAALTLLPALLAITGRRIERLRIRLPFRRSEREQDAFWSAWTERVMARPGLALALGTALMLTLAAPLLTIDVGSGALNQLPPDAEVRIATERLAGYAGPGAFGPIEALAENRADAERFARAAKGVEGVVSVSPPIAASQGSSHLVRVAPAAAPESDEARATLARLRGLPESEDLVFGGVTSFGEDLDEAIFGGLWLVVLFVLATSYVILLMLLRSVLLPLKAVLMNLLSVGAAYGVLVAVFQWGWLDWTGYDSPGYVDTIVPVMLLAVTFGLSMDYEVFLLTRIRERYLATRDNARAVAEGLARSARTITAAALIMVAVFGSFALAGALSIKELGLGLAVAIFLDATVVRLVLVPAAMRLLGEWNWWLPAALARLAPGAARPATK
jgi:uncharacterized membrane protein YdfJ with MMPL/SSD domain